MWDDLGRPIFWQTEKLIYVATVGGTMEFQICWVSVSEKTSLNGMVVWLPVPG